MIEGGIFFGPLRSLISPVGVGPFHLIQKIAQAQLVASQ